MNSLAQGIASISMDGIDAEYVMITDRPPPPRQEGYTGLQPLRFSSSQSSFGDLSIPPASGSTGREEIRMNSGIAINLPSAQTLFSVMQTDLDRFTELDKLHWAQDVVRLLDRTLRSYTGEPLSPATRLARTTPFDTLITSAVIVIISSLSSHSPTISASAHYLKAHLLSTGNVPDHLDLGIQRDPRQAFKHYEVAARGGEVRGWFRLGRDYELCEEVERAKGCYEKGVAKGDGECLYRMGLAYLSGQLDTVAQPVLGVDYLRRAALFATVDSPQAAYTFGMLLSGESSLEIPFPSHILISPTLPISTPGLKTQLEESKSFILRAAYLCHPPAQYKAGMMYEHARLTCPYDPLLSVQYYALASQEGELEADMALSKWFLVGAEGCFEKNEELTRTFAEKAGKGRLPIALFALGYYNELGIGGKTNIEEAKRWYKKAAKRGNQEASTRLLALNQPIPTALSETDHVLALNSTLVRKHTTAKEKSDKEFGGRLEKQANTEEVHFPGALRDSQTAQGQGDSSYVPMVPPLPSMPPITPTPSITQRGPANDWRSYQPECSPQAWIPELPPSPAIIATNPSPARQPRISAASNTTQGRATPQMANEASSASIPLLGMFPEPSISFNSLKPQHQQLRRASGTPYELSPSSSQASSTAAAFQADRSRRRQSYALHDPGFVTPSGTSIPRLTTPHHDRAENDARQKTSKEGEHATPLRVPGAHKGADTFEQMGFVSKPVQGDNDCLVM